VSKKKGVPNSEWGGGVLKRGSATGETLALDDPGKERRTPKYSEGLGTPTGVNSGGKTWDFLTKKDAGPGRRNTKPVPVEVYGNPT